MDLESAGKLGLKVGNGEVDLEVSMCDVGDKFYYVVRIQRECFERVFVSLGSEPLVSLKEFEPRTPYFPDSTEAFAATSPVIVKKVEEDNEDGSVLDSRVVRFGQKAFWRTRIRDVVKNISDLVKEVFAENTDVDEVMVMVDANGEEIIKPFEGVVLDEETGEF